MQQARKASCERRTPVVSIKALDTLTPADLWREVPLEEEFWQEAQERQRRMLKVLLEEALEGEQLELLAAARYRRVETRQGYRNGFYQRDLATQIGIVTGIRVPRCRTGAGGCKSQVFSRYRRRQAQVDGLIRAVFLAGVSTRRVGEALAAVLGEPVSAQTVSRVTRSLDREVERFHQRPLSDDIRYLFLDGVSMRIRSATQVKRRLVLCVYGITVTGERRLLDHRLAKSESQAAWEAFLNQLRERGFLGHHLQLITTDGCPGLHGALDVVYPYVPRQRCWVHKLRNVAGNLRRAQQRDCLAGARAIYQAATQREAVRCYWAWAQRWRREAPKAVGCLEQDLDSLLAFLSCPEAHRRAVRTTNAIERAFREVRRRTRPMTCFTNDASCERIIYA
ncbi:IS256 family transposase, partial [bacterium]